MVPDTPDTGSMRDDISAAFTEAEAGAGSPAPEPTGQQPGGSSTPGVQSGGTGEGRARNDRGQFSRSEATAQQVSPARPAAAPAAAPVAPGAAPAPAGAAPVPMPAPAPGALKAPGGWSPEARETFHTLPVAAQKEIVRREREISDTLSRTVEARRGYEEFTNVVQPYLSMIQAEQSTPVMAVKSLLQTAAALRTGTPAYKAQLVAGLIRDFSIDPALLEQAYSSALEGKGGAPGVMPVNPDANIQALLQKQLAPVQEFMNRFQQAEMQRSQSELEAFVNDPANEFIQDVAEDVADMLQLAAQRGRAMSLQEAYSRATLAHPSISKILEDRRLAEGTAQQTAAALRARDAGASISSQSAPLRTEEEDDGSGSLRSDLLSSVRAVSSRR